MASVLHELYEQKSLGKFRALLSSGSGKAAGGGSKSGGGHGNANGGRDASSAAGGVAGAYSQGGSSLSRSPRFPGLAQDLGSATATKEEVNARDGYGRTVLHLVVTDGGQPIERRQESTSASKRRLLAASTGAGTAAEGAAPYASTIKDLLSASSGAVTGNADEKDAQRALEYLEPLLQCPTVNVNLQDRENGYTALHRAAYAGNLVAARRLLQHPDVETGIRDLEGLTAFDLLNSTLLGTNPADALEGTPADDAPRRELVTWGANRNFVLGLQGDSDRTFPERVPLERSAAPTARSVSEEAFAPLRVTKIVMEKLHSGLMTDEPRANFRVCGAGSSTGRLGHASNHPQFSFEPLKGFEQQCVTDFALGQDHTILCTDRGDVWTFGLNAFSVLGHPPEAPTPTKQGGSAAEEPVQVLPKRLVGVLKKEFVLGVAASRYHSCAYTSDSLYTWGKNNGQLGYPALATPLQHTPRKVTALAQPIQQMCATEVATVCLLEGGEVFVLHRDTHYKIAAFPMSRFPPSMQVYRPPGISARPTIFKVAGSGGTFIALSTRGDVFSWTLDNPALEGASASFAAPGAGTGRDVKPVRIWEDRKTFTAVADAAIAGETIVLATRSGHVFVRSRKKELATVRGFELKGGASGAQSNSGAGVSGNARKGLFKFVKVANLQRVVSVAVSPSGGFGAIRADAPLLDIAEQGDALPDSLLTLLPHYRRLQDEHDKEALVQDSLPRPSLVGDALRDETGEEEDDEAIGDDRIALDRICRCLQRWDATWSNATSAAGSDILVVANPSGVKIPAHSAVLAARSPVLAAALQSDNPHTSGVQISRNGTSTLSLPKCSHLSVLLLLHYLYTDTLPAIYDARLFTKIRTVYPDIDFSPIDIKAELQSLANLCELPALGSALRAYGKALPQATLASNLLRFKGDSEAADVVLETEQEDFRCHSVVLRARSPFFASMLDDPDWYAPRTLSDSGDGKTRRASLHVDMQHISADIIRLVLRYIYTDPTAAELFEEKIFERPDEKLDYLMSVMAAANELLLDRLKAVCSGVIRPLVNMQTVCSVLCEAIFYEEASLQVCCTQYICCNMETMLEQRLLDILPLYALDRLAAFCQEKQLDRLPRTARMGARLAELRVTHAAWLKDRDFARNTGGFRRFVRRQTVVGVGAKSPRLSPAMFSTSLRLSPSGVLSPPRASEPVRSGSRQPPSPTITASPGPSPLIEAVIPEDDEGMFDMDDLKLDEGDAATPRRVASPAVTSTNKAPWQRPVLPSAATAPRSLRDIMAGDAGRSDSSRTTASHPFPALGMASSTPPSASGPGIASKASASAESPVSAPVQRLSQRDRKRQQQVTAEQQQLAAAEAEAKRSAGPTASSSPWRPSAPPAAWKPPDSPALASPGIGASGLAARPSFSSIQSAQASSPSIGSGFPVSQSAASSPAFRRTSSTAISRTPSGSGAGATPASNSGTPVRPSPQHQLSQGGTPPVNPASAIGAPVITPTRLQPPKRTVSNLHPYSQGPPERRSSDVPWVNYTSTVAVLPDASNAQLGSSSGAIWEDAAQEQQSFATIQSLQATEREALRSKKGPRSLAEIQAEENAQREEAAFLVWFEEESRKAQTELGRGNAPAHSQARQKREPSDGAGRSGRGRGRGGGSERGGRGGGGGRGKGAHTGASASEGHSAAPEQPRHGLARGEHRGDGQSGRGRGRGSKRGGKGQEASNNNNGPPTPAAGGLSANAKPFEMGTL